MKPNKLVPFVLLLAASSASLAVPIHPTDKYAWSENVGWINHRDASGAVQVFADHLEGFAWAENIGWVKLGSHSGGGAHTYANNSNTDWGVNNNGSGVLSGYAWSENVGWINFAPSNGGVTIADGVFDGFAWGENIGWVRFRNDSIPYRVALENVTLTLGKAGTGDGAMGGGGIQAPGAAVTLTATPDPSSTFAGWSPSPCAPSFNMPYADLTCTATFNSAGPPELTLKGNGVPIACGDNTPDAADGTDFGNIPSGSGMRTYTLANDGLGKLTVSALDINGCSAEFVITKNPAPVAIHAADADTFTITYTPTNEGTDRCTVTVSSDDANEGACAFDIAATSAPVCGPSTGFALPARQWRNIGQPCQGVLPNTVLSHFDDELGTFTTNPSSTSGWAMQQRNIDSTGNVFMQATGTLAQGAGYWIKSMEAPSRGLTAPGTATPTDTPTGCPDGYECFAVTLTTSASAARTNLVSNPFPYPVDASDLVILVNGSTAYTLSGAKNAGILATNTLYRYTGTAYEAFDDMTPGTNGNIDAFAGFWIKVNPSSVPIQLLVPAKASLDTTQAVPESGLFSRLAGLILEWLVPSAQAAPPADARLDRAERKAARAAHRQDIATKQAWYVTLNVTDPAEELVGPRLVLGQLRGAQVGRDDHDLPTLEVKGKEEDLLPPGVDTLPLNMVFPRPAWSRQAGDYATDYRPASQRPQANTWTFAIRVDQDRDLVLRWEATDPAILARSQIRSLDTGQVWAADDPALLEEGLPVTVFYPEARFEWRVTSGKR